MRFGRLRDSRSITKTVPQWFPKVAKGFTVQWPSGLPGLGVSGSLFLRNLQMSPYHGATMTVILEHERRLALGLKGWHPAFSGSKVLN